MLCEQITNIINVLSTDLTTWMSLMILAKFKVFSPSFNSRSNHPYILYFLFRPQNIFFLEKVVSEIAKTNICASSKQLSHPYKKLIWMVNHSKELFLTICIQCCSVKECSYLSCSDDGCLNIFYFSPFCLMNTKYS